MLILLFSILAVNGGVAALNLVVLAVIFAACCFLTFIVGRQPQSKTKLSFTVWRGWGCFNAENFIDVDISLSLLLSVATFFLKYIYNFNHVKRMSRYIKLEG